MAKQYIGFVTGIVLGVLVTLCMPRSLAGKKQPGADRPISFQLYHFRLQPDSLEAYRQWVNWQHSDHHAIVASLEREHMYVEAVFRDSIRDPYGIYWLAVSGAGGAAYQTSPLRVDTIHADFMRRILVKGSRTTLQTAFTLLPDFICQAIHTHATKNH